MASIERRLEALEAHLPDENGVFEQFCRCLPPLDANGNLAWGAVYPELLEVFGPWLREKGAKSSWKYRRLDDDLERGLADLLHLFTAHSEDIFANIERFRGRIPDRVLAEIYNERRNLVGADSLRIRELAGVVDENGQPLPGYVLRENGCINDAEITHSSVGESVQ